MSARRIAIAGSPAHQVIDGGVLHLVEITSSGGAWTLSGISGGTDGQLLLIVNRGAYTISLAHEDSTVSARFRIQTPDALAHAVAAGYSALCAYDYLTGRWVLANVSEYGMPSGAIVMWSGAVSAIP